MKFENVETHGFEAALRGMRNAHKSHHLASKEDDERLARTLIYLGPSHRKFLRQIMLWVDITAPRFWWSEFDTYKIGVSANSESTMHTLLRDGITEKDFVDEDCGWEVLYGINSLAIAYRKETDPKKKNKLLRSAKAGLPEGFLQKRTVCMTYEAARNMYQQRHDHSLREWLEFCDFLKTLPHSEWITA